jgi:predicted TPR repeat methyltransferase
VFRGVKSSFNRLFEQGVDHSLSGNLEAAVGAWEKALEIDPENKTIEVNLQIIRKKLARSRPSPPSPD